MNIVQRIKYAVFGDSPLPRLADYASQVWPFFTAQITVRFYYYFLLYTSLTLFVSWDLSFAPQTEVSFILPLVWLKYVSFPVGFILIRGAFVISSLLVSLAPHKRIFRILSFVSLLEYVALYYSVLKLDVDWYGILIMSFLLIFLPDNWNRPLEFSTASRQKFLLVFWGCQASLLLTYSMSGIGKVFGAIKQISAGQASIFDPQSPALHTAQRLLATDSISPLGPWVLEYSALLWPMFLGTTYLLLFSFFVAFKPNLHRLWGIGLILFHVVNYFVINIGFSAHVLQVALLLILSPFIPSKLSWREMVRNLPGLDLFLKK